MLKGLGETIKGFVPFGAQFPPMEELNLWNVHHFADSKNDFHSL